MSNKTTNDRVQVWITKQARQRLRLLAVTEERELMEQLGICVDVYDALKEAAGAKGMTVSQLLERLAGDPEEVTPPEDQTRRTPNA